MAAHIDGHKRPHRGGGMRAIVAALVLILTGTSSAWAHQDPADCSQPTIVFGMKAYFAGTDVQIQTAALIDECTEVEYQAFVMAIGNPIACAFQGGTITITTPDGAPHNATPAGGIPCLGGTSAPCTPGVNGPVDSERVKYVINKADADADGLVLADAEYNAELLHTDGDDTANQPNATSAFPLEVVLCPTDDPCVSDVCETAPDGSGVCIPEPNSTPCPDTDDNVCTMAGCDGEGICDQSHVTPDSTPCGAGDP